MIFRLCFLELSTVPRNFLYEASNLSKRLSNAIPNLFFFSLPVKIRDASIGVTVKEVTNENIVAMVTV